jgi:hypothetical protein
VFDYIEASYSMSRTILSAILLSVLETDNVARVRDGYISESTRRHARARPTHCQLVICRTNVLANDRACTRLPRQNLHGKEGVDGSSPSEGSNKRKIPANRGFLLSAAEPQITSGYSRDRRRFAAPLVKCLQIGMFPDTAEHLLEREGLDDARLGGRIENGLTERRSERLLWRQRRGSDWG